VIESSPLPALLAALALVPLTALLAAGFNAIKAGANRTSRDLVHDIDQLLPQSQCGQCGYPGCRPYAEAVAAGEAINRCAPGGEPTLRALAELMQQPVRPLAVEQKPRAVAYIREAECIGCTKCIQACPVDAIVGAARLMHTVIADECTGCDLCVEPCPVDCIEMRPLPAAEQRIAMPRLIASDGGRQ
jgi:electron transport complex protein RnfB